MTITAAIKAAAARFLAPFAPPPQFTPRIDAAYIAARLKGDFK